MPVTGLVVVLDPHGDACSPIDALRANTRCTLGPDSAGGRVPLVLETDSDEESRRQLAWIESLAGVAMVEVAYVDLSDLNSEREDEPDGC